MRKLTLGLLALLASVMIVLPLAAQEGHPLKGSWLGDWGAGTTNRNQVFVVFDWDGKVISGSINPGTETIMVKNASLTPTPIAPPPGAAAPAAGAGGGGGQGGGRGGGGGGQGGGGGRGGGGQAATAAAPAAGAPAAAVTPAPAPAAGAPAATAGTPAPAGAAPAAGAAAGAGGGGQGGGNRGGGRGGGGLGGNGAGTTAAAPVEWVVHFEGDGKDSKGAMVHYMVDGKIENIGLYNRSLTGTWVSGATKGTFKLTRQ